MKTITKSYYAALAMMRNLHSRLRPDHEAIEAIEVKIARMRCQPGDAMVITCERTLTPVQVQHLREQVERHKPEGVAVLVLCGGLQLKVLAQGPDE